MGLDIMRAQPNQEEGSCMDNGPQLNSIDKSQTVSNNQDFP